MTHFKVGKLLAVDVRVVNRRLHISMNAVACHSDDVSSSAFESILKTALPSDLNNEGL